MAIDMASGTSIMTAAASYDAHHMMHMHAQLSIKQFACEYRPNDLSFSIWYMQLCHVKFLPVPTDLNNSSFFKYIKHVETNTNLLQLVKS